MSIRGAPICQVVPIWLELIFKINCRPRTRVYTIPVNSSVMLYAAILVMLADAAVPAPEPELVIGYSVIVACGCPPVGEVVESLKVKSGSTRQM